MIDCSNIQKEDAHIKRNIKNTLILPNVWHCSLLIKLNNFSTQHINSPRHLFHSFCCTTCCIFEPRVYMSPALLQINMVMHCLLHIFPHLPFANTMFSPTKIHTCINLWICTPMYMYINAYICTYVCT